MVSVAPSRTSAVNRTSSGFELRGETTPFRELLAGVWDSGPLIVILARKDFYVRYRRATFGLLWAVALPLFQSAVLAFVFSRVAKGLVPSGVNYTAFIFAGMVGWSFFSSAFPSAATSIVDGAGLSSKIYFPRIILPVVSVLSAAYGFAISVVVMIAVSAVAGADFGLSLVLIVPAIALAVVLTTSLGVAAAALHVYFRDVRYIVSAVLVPMIYITPVFYPLRKAPGLLRTVVKVNPLTGVVELFRAATVGADPGWVGTVLVTLAWSAVALTVGLALHRRFNRVFADLL
jgi:lipopolysaccharide transport system permease protein